MKTIDDLMETKPLLIRANSPGLLINGNPVVVDCRIISETNYQALIGYISEANAEISRLSRDNTALKAQVRAARTHIDRGFPDS